MSHAISLRLPMALPPCPLDGRTLQSRFNCFSFTDFFFYKIKNDDHPFNVGGGCCSLWLGDGRCLAAVQLRRTRTGRRIPRHWPAAGSHAGWHSHKT